MSVNESMNPTFKILSGHSIQELIQNNEFEKKTNTYQRQIKKKKMERELKQSKYFDYIIIKRDLKK